MNFIKSIAFFKEICYTFSSSKKMNYAKMEVEMAKSKTVFVCNECGYEASKWMGKCPACNSWNSFFEQKVFESKNSLLKAEDRQKTVPQPLNKYEAKETLRTSTGFCELDRVLGGGLVKGSLILLGGEPGIGKSTLILQICDKFCKREIYS